jgi:glycosyltransferase involved in cell wall biosynthesis
LFGRGSSPVLPSLAVAGSSDTGSGGVPPTTPTSKISVVVPCHNYGRFLTEALASVLAQSRPADEIVIVNDGSTDETEEVIGRFRAEHPDTVVISRFPNLGAVRTFNDGVAAASGDLIVILSADDTMSANYLSELEGAISPDRGFAYAQLRLFGAQSTVRPAERYSPDALARLNFVNGSAMFRRALFDEVGGFSERFAGTHEDWAFWLAARRAGWIGVGVNTCWLNYRQHPTASRNAVSRFEIASLFPRLRRAGLVTRAECLSGVRRYLAGEARRGVGRRVRSIRLKMGR